MTRIGFTVLTVIALFTFVQPEKQPMLGRTSRDHRRVQGRSNRLVVVTGTETTEYDGWVIECVDCTPIQLGGMSERSLQLDSQGHPHIAYGGEGLYYAWFDGTKFHFVPVNNYPPEVSYVSLDLDRGGYAHIG